MNFLLAAGKDDCDVDGFVHPSQLSSAPLLSLTLPLLIYATLMEPLGLSFVISLVQVSSLPPQSRLVLASFLVLHGICYVSRGNAMSLPQVSLQCMSLYKSM